jgi:hypothetical protein
MLAVALFAIVTLQQAPAVDRDCVNDQLDRCGSGQQDRVRAALAMAAIEAESAAGAEVYRAFFIDGYGRDMPGIAFERRHGAPPEVVVYGLEGVRMSAEVSTAIWLDVQNRARFATRELTPPPGEGDEPFNICLHPWVYTVEITNAAERGVPNPEIKRRTEDSCQGGLTARFANDLAALAIKKFPACDALDADEHRNDIARLEVCGRFRGDRLAAAELMNQIGWRVTPEEDAETPFAWSRSFGVNASTRLEWDGQVIQANRSLRNNAAAVFLAEQQRAHPDLRGYIRRFDGVSSTEVQTEGWFRRENEGGEYLSAPFRQVWVWDDAGLGWILQSWTVDAFAPPEPAREP